MSSYATSPGPRGFAGISADGFQQRFVIVGSGTPEAVISGDPGSLYFDSTALVMYAKATGTAKTGWTSATSGSTFKAGDGTAAAPSYSFSSTGSDDNGMYLSAADTLAFANGGVLALSLGASQLATFAGTISLPNTSVIKWATHSQIKNDANGVISLLNAAGTSFSRLRFGGTTSSFPCLLFSGTTSKFRLADDSADSPMTASTGTFSSTVGVGGATADHGATCFITTNTQSSACSGATTTIGSNLIPAGSIVIGVCARVTTAIGTSTSFGIGDGTNATRFGALISPLVNTTTTTANWTVTSAPVYAAATQIVLTANGGSFSSGQVEVTTTYINTTAPTS